MRSKQLDIQFPAAGVVRRLGNTAGSNQGPFAAPWSMNVRLEDSLTNRLRGGSFAGRAAVAKSSPVYRDRALTTSGRAIHASRVGVHSDFSISADLSDSMRPSVFQAAMGGEQGSTVVAVVPHKDSYLLVFTATSLWILAGDPVTGSMRRISDQVGIIGSSAWCVAHDMVYFLSSRGLYSVGADGSGLKPVSEERLPQDLIGVTDAACVLDYNHADRGVYINTTGQDWFYDTARDGFWPFSTSTTASHVLIGPLKLAPHADTAVLSEFEGTLAATSCDVFWYIIVGDSAEEVASNGKAAITAYLAGNTSAAEAYARFSGMIGEGRSRRFHPRLRGQWFAIWLRASSAWAYEWIHLQAEEAGRYR